MKDCRQIRVAHHGTAKLIIVSRRRQKRKQALDSTKKQSGSISKAVGVHSGVAIA